MEVRQNLEDERDSDSSNFSDLSNQMERMHTAFNSGESQNGGVIKAPGEQKLMLETGSAYNSNFSSSGTGSSGSAAAAAGGPQPRIDKLTCL